MAHKFSRIVFRCMDGRLNETFFEWLKNNDYLHDSDLICWAGTAKEIADGTATGEAMLGQIELSAKLHGIQEVVLWHHTNCGGYALAYDFADDHAEISKQSEDLEKIKSIILERFPGMKVSKVIAVINDHNGHDIDVKAIN